jgi:hypothetical protein
LQIRGAFEITVTARFDNPNGASYQKVFDFGNGPSSDNVWFGQKSNLNTMSLSIWLGGTFAARLDVTNAIVAGENAIWKCGADIGGLMWIEKNGIRLGQLQAVIPSNVARTKNLFGKSNWSSDAPLQGEVLDFNLINLS